jgi:hypothetical protein
LWRWKKLFSTINKKKQIVINHAKGKTKLSFCSLHRKWYYKIVVIWKGDQRVCCQKIYENSIISMFQAVN